jgi:hypothetical protein
LPFELANVLRAMRRDVDPEFRHDGHRLGSHGPGFVPADITSKRSPAIDRSSPSAIWLRAELPVHR